MDIGKFLDEKYARKIINENLFVNGEPVFQRADDLQVGNMKAIKRYLSNATVQNVEGVREIAQNSLNREELFLTNGFKLIFSQKFTKMIVNWFASKFMVIYRADSMQLMKRFSDPKKKTIYVEKTTDKAAKLFGINSNTVGYVVSEEEPDAKLYSVFRNKVGNKNAAIAAEIFESYGTIRFINLFPLVMKAILTGGTLVVDEFDASIHPMALMSIINIFHNDDINIHHAQLIFNTHNPARIQVGEIDRFELFAVVEHISQALTRVDRSSSIAHKVHCSEGSAVAPRGHLASDAVGASIDVEVAHASVACFGCDGENRLIGIERILHAIAPIDAHCRRG